MPKTYDPIQTATASGSQSQIDFTNISQNYTDLLLVYAITYSSVPAARYTRMRVGNGSIDTGSNYSETYILGQGSAAFSGRLSNQTFFDGLGTITAASQVANGVVQFMNYSNTTTNKTHIRRVDNAGAETIAYVGLWRSTSAINCIRFYEFAGNNFAAGSTFTLYGIKAA